MKLLLCSLVIATLAMAADVTGTWSGTFKGNEDPQDSSLTLILKQTGTEITGTAGPAADHQMAIQKGKIEGDKITIEVAVGDGTFKFDLVVDGEHMKGDLNASRGDEKRSAKVEVTRAK